MLTNKIFNASALNRHYLASADPGHPYRWLGSAIWMTLVSCIDYLGQQYEKSILRPSLPASYSHSSLSIILLHLTIIFSLHYSHFAIKPL